MSQSSMRPVVQLLASCLWAFASFAHAQQLTLTPFHASGIYDLRETAGWTITGIEGEAAKAKYRYTVKTNNLDLIKRGAFDLSSGKATIEVQLDEPAMLYIQVYPDDIPADVAKPIATLGAAIAPSRLPPSAPRPADFDEFWSSKLKLLATVPVNPVLTPVATDVAGVDLNIVKLDSVGSHVQGYLARPKREGKFPALMLYQYAGVYALQPNTAALRAAEGWLAFNVSSHDMPPTESAGAPRNYQAVGNTDRETSYFLNMYLRDTRAIDYITSRPDWDGRAVVLMGTSMGGQQSLVTAGLNPDRITAVIVNEPSGADSNGNLHGRRTGYPNWPSEDPKIMQTALYFDTVNFASRIKAATLASMGFIDTIAPPAGIWAAINQISGAKEAVPMVESDHNNITPDKQGAYNTRSKEILDLILQGGVFKPNEEFTRPAGNHNK
jgi:cephalosporin-C deacetylase-like acetyl esterase